MSDVQKVLSKRNTVVKWIGRLLSLVHQTKIEGYDSPVCKKFVVGFEDLQKHISVFKNVL